MLNVINFKINIKNLKNNNLLNLWNILIKCQHFEIFHNFIFCWKLTDISLEINIENLKYSRHVICIFFIIKLILKILMKI